MDHDDLLAGFCRPRALSQFLPRPASGQTDFGIELMRGGLPGGFAAWTSFTMPSVILMVLFACGSWFCFRP